MDTTQMEYIIYLVEFRSEEINFGRLIQDRADSIAILRI